MAKTVYQTNEWDGYGKHNHYHNEYRVDGDEVTKVRVHRQKFFDGDENTWETEEKVIDSWDKDDSSMPGWLRQYL